MPIYATEEQVSGALAEVYSELASMSKTVPDDAVLPHGVQKGASYHPVPIVVSTVSVAMNVQGLKMTFVGSRRSKPEPLSADFVRAAKTVGLDGADDLTVGQIPDGHVLQSAVGGLFGSSDSRLDDHKEQQKELQEIKSRLVPLLAGRGVPWQDWDPDNV